MLSIFWCSTINYLTFGDLYGHFYSENWSFVFIASWHTKIKFLLNVTTWFSIDDLLPELLSFLLAAKLLRFTCHWAVIYLLVDNYVKIYQIFQLIKMIITLEANHQLNVLFSKNFILVSCFSKLINASGNLSQKWSKIFCIEMAVKVTKDQISNRIISKILIIRCTIYVESFIITVIVDDGWGKRTHKRTMPNHWLVSS